MASILTGSYWTSLGSALIRTLRDFPRESLISAAMMVAFWIVAHVPSNDFELVVMRTAMGLILSLSISLTCTVLRRAGRISRIVDWALSAALMSITIWYLQFFDFDGNAGATEFAYLAVWVHLAVACVLTVYTGAGSFWNATTALFYRALYAGVFTSLLQAGLMLAIASVRVLFGWNEFDKLEVDLMIAVSTLVMTLFFLADFPSRERVERQPIVPKLTVSFVQYVLTPIIAVFTVILYAYGVKLISTQMSGEMVSYVVLLTAVSVLASLLTWPIRNEPRPLLVLLHKWIYPLLLPLLLLGAWSLVARFSTEGIDRWGFTLGVLESIGLLTIIISIVTRTSDPRIPALVSLGVFAVTSVGPLGVNAVVARYEAHTPKDHVEASPSAKTDDTPRGLDHEPNITTCTGNRQWIAIFECDPDDTLRTRDARITSSDEGIIKVVRTQPADTIFFDLLPMLAKLDHHKDTAYPAITASSVNGKSATLRCINIGAKYSMDGSGKNARRRIGNVMGLVVVSDE